MTEIQTVRIHAPELTDMPLGELRFSVPTTEDRLLVDSDRFIERTPLVIAKLSETEVTVRRSGNTPFQAEVPEVVPHAEYLLIVSRVSVFHVPIRHLHLLRSDTALSHWTVADPEQTISTSRLQTFLDALNYSVAAKRQKAA